MCDATQVGVEEAPQRQHQASSASVLNKISQNCKMSDWTPIVIRSWYCCEVGEGEGGRWDILCHSPCPNITQLQTHWEATNGNTACWPSTIHRPGDDKIYLNIMTALQFKILTFFISLHPSSQSAPPVNSWLYRAMEKILQTDDFHFWVGVPLKQTTRYNETSKTRLRLWFV